MRNPSPVLRGSTTALGLAPALAVLLVTGQVLELLGVGVFLWVGRPLVCANAAADLWMFSILLGIYTLWVLGALRGGWSWATGGGLTVAGAGVFLRIVVEWPQMLAQTPLAVRSPPEPYGTALVLGRALGIAARVRPGVRRRRRRRRSAATEVGARVDASALTARATPGATSQRARRAP